MPTSSARPAAIKTFFIHIPMMFVPGGEAVGHKVGRALESAHLRECEHVGHARADACVEGTSEVDLTVGAQEGVANPGFRPGREGNKRVEVGVEGAA